MYPAPFAYHRASSISHALDLLAEHEDAKILAGGHSLLPMMKLRLAMPETVIDIGRIPDLRGVREEGDSLHIGALTTHSDLEGCEKLAKSCPLVPKTAKQIADPAVRNRGTIGGSLAHADPASDLPGVMVALRAIFHLRGPDGARTVPASEFFVGLLETAVRDDELLLTIQVPATSGAVAYEKMEQQASGYAVCGAAAIVEDGRVRLAFNGVTATPVDASDAAEAWVQTGDVERLRRDIDDAVRSQEVLDDIFSSAEYRVHLAKVYGRRALDAARAAA